MMLWRRKIGAIGLAALAAGCLGPRMPVDRVPPTPVTTAMRPAIAPDTAAPGETLAVPLAGRVDFGRAETAIGAAPGIGAGRRSQALASEVVDAATVALIDLAAGATLAGGKTDENGAFTLALGSAEVVQGKVYLLEAVRGLGSHKPGHAAPRFRTFVTWDGAAWRSISTPGVFINALTTAVAIATGLDPAVDPAATLGRVDVGVTPPTLKPPSFQGHPDDELYLLAADVLAALASDADPVAAIVAFRPEIAEISPASGKAGDPVAIRGKGFSPNAADNTVKFGSARAAVLAASPTRLVVAVPSEATTGDATVTTALGRSNGLPFSVAASVVEGTRISSVEPGEGYPGMSITIVGEDFSDDPAQNQVSFTGGTATPAEASTTGLVVAVPQGARSGVLTVTGPKGKSNPFWFRVPPHIDEVFPRSGAPGSTVTVSGSGFGTSPGTVAFGGVAGTVLSWSDTRVEVTIPPRATSGQLTLTGSAGSATLPAFEVLAGTLTGAFSTPMGHLPYGAVHDAAPVLRIGKYLYAFGGKDGDGGYHKYIHRAPLSWDGKLGSWEAAGELKRPAAWNPQAAVIVGPYVYIIGGHDGSQPDARGVQCATIREDGSLSEFIWVATTLRHPCHGHTAHVIGNYLYVFNGYDYESLGYMKKVQRVPIKPDYTLDGDFQDVGETVYAMYLRTSQVVGSWVYLFGGSNGGGQVNVVERARVNHDGTLGAFAHYDTLPRNFSQGGSVVLGDTLYLLYGLFGSDYTNGFIYKASIGGPTGDVGPFTDAGITSGQGHRYPCPVAVGNRMYVLGGFIGYPVSYYDTYTIQ